jgi:hypothetical protein
MKTDQRRRAMASFHAWSPMSKIERHTYEYDFYLSLLKYASNTIAFDIKAAKYYGSLTSEVREHKNRSLSVMFKKIFWSRIL